MLAALTFALAPVVLAAPPFAQLPTHGAAARISWSWPQASLFETTRATEARVATVAMGQVVTLEKDGVGAEIASRLKKGASVADIAAWVGGTKAARTYAEAIAVAEIPPDGQGHVSVDTLQFGRRFGGTTAWTVRTDGDVALLVAPDRVVAVTGASITQRGSIHSEAWTDWVYATTLMQSDPPVYATDRGTNDGDEAVNERWAQLESAMHEGPKAGLAAIDEFPLDQLSDRDWRLGTVAEYLAGNGRLDQAVELYRRFAPIGRCSMDTGPAMAAQNYADACYARGNIGCFLQLQVRIMGDRFDRVAWSSYGERAASTHVQRLSDAGIDVRRFLRGLLLDFTVDGPKREWIGRWRLVRSMMESGMGDAFEKELTGLAVDGKLDDYNRLRATQALWLMWRRAADIGKDKAALRFAQLDLNPASERWITAVERLRGEN